MPNSNWERNEGRKEMGRGSGLTRALALTSGERTWWRVSQILKEWLRMTRINLSPLLAKMGDTFIFYQSSGTLGLF